VSNPSINKALIVGRVDAPPKIHSSGEGKERMGFRVRTNRAWRDKTFSTVHLITVWGNMITDIRNLQEGDCVSVDGRIDNRKYEVDGETKWTTEVVASDVQVFASEAAGANSALGPEDDLPF
jgi:single-strand DNA-binding protein